MFLDRKEIVLQFFLGKKGQIPAKIIDRERPCIQGAIGPMVSGGELVIGHQPDCDISELPEGLYGNDFWINDACWQERRSDVYVVRFFLSTKGAPSSEENDFWDAFEDLSGSGFWKAWAYRDPGKIKINFGNRCAQDGKKPKSCLYVMNGEIQTDVC